MIDPSIGQTAIALFVVVGGLIGWEIFAFFTARKTISATVWHWALDRNTDGAPIIFLMGFIMGHFVMPPSYEGVLRSIMILGSVALITHEVTATALTGLNTVSRWLWRLGGRHGPTVAFLGGFVIASQMFSR